MKFDTITIDRQDTIWLVTLNRPERLNAMNQKMLLEMDSACDMIEEDTPFNTLVTYDVNGQTFRVLKDTKKHKKLQQKLGY